MSARLRVHDGTFRYPGAPTPILERIEVEVDDGELLAILGPNGAGKTTLLRTMLGLQKWDLDYIFRKNVKITIDGQALTTEDLTALQILIEGIRSRHKS